MKNLFTGRTTPKDGELSYEKTDFNVRMTDSPMDLKLMNEGNRKIKPSDVKSLTKSFLIRKQIYRPLIVDENQKVLDGQHRITAARHLSKYNNGSNSASVEVPYIVAEGYGLQQVRALNMNQKKLTKDDYIDIYADKGIESYVNIKNLIKEGDYKLPLYDIVKVSKLDPSVKFESGRIKYPKLAVSEVEDGSYTHGDLDFTNEILDWHQSFIELGNVKIKNNLSKMMIRMYLLSRDIFDPDRFYDNFKKCTEVARLPLLKDEDLKEALSTIYNYNYQESKHIDLTFELD